MHSHGTDKIAGLLNRHLHEFLGFIPSVLPKKFK